MVFTHEITNFAAVFFVLIKVYFPSPMVGVFFVFSPGFITALHAYGGVCVFIFYSFEWFYFA